ncbi:MAG TPA: SDR family NAD(P)-dependent oxidoreductase [Blastocatellia bacterium]|nr:SDR family NAD(P)-dependent oxidoreductase [Blastocatellia bacterium]
MKVYDRNSAGFWPGEGCGFVVLMRHGDALAQGRRVYGVIQGWGISSDGSGGITRPTVDGQSLALRRAYRRAGFGIETVSYFEGHGTGTSVGDATELRALSKARREAAFNASPAVIGSIKANIGHTKAAAGLAGLIKATLALHRQILPPTSGCKDPHPELTSDRPALRVLDKGMAWPADKPLRAGVSAMGFGGINTHVVLENLPASRREMLSVGERALLSSAQDAELFLLSSGDADGLRQQIEHLSTIAPRLSRAELADLASELESTLEINTVRAAIIASTPKELAHRLEILDSWLKGEAGTRMDDRSGVFLGSNTRAPRIGFLFPGQGSPTYSGGGRLRARFDYVEELYSRASIPESSNGIATEIAQPAIITASAAALRVLERLGIRANVAIGHSLGEVAALYWGGAFDEEALLRIATARGKAMGGLSAPEGKMASVLTGEREVESLLNGEPVVIAALNSPRQTVVSGEAAAVEAFVNRLQSRGVKAVNLRVSHAFHSPLMLGAIPAFEEALKGEDFYSLQRKVVSTITGGPLDNSVELRSLLCRQLTSPVRFTEAFGNAAREVDLWLEVGPGRVLSDLVAGATEAPVIPMDAGGSSLKGVLLAAGAAFALGGSINPAAIFAGRFTRPFDLDWRPRFFANPCESAPLPEATAFGENTETVGRESLDVSATVERSDNSDLEYQPAQTPGGSPLNIVRHLVAERAELPPSSVKDDSKLLSDLHLNSITVGQLITEAARRMGLRRPVSPTDYADASVGEIALALDELARTETEVLVEEDYQVPGVDSWVRAFTVELVERPLPAMEAPDSNGTWKVLAPPGYPLAEAVTRSLEASGVGGVALCLLPDVDERHLKLLLDAARAVIDAELPTRFVLVQHSGGAASFARTLHQEMAELTTCVIDLPMNPKAVERISAEVRVATGYSEAHYDQEGRRYEPVLKLLNLSQQAEDLPFGPEDVLLVTGGGKGITAECAFSIASQTRTKLVLIGLSKPENDKELYTNLKRMRQAGLRFIYISVDVTDAAAVRTAVAQVEEVLGPITGVLQGAAINAPQLLRTLEEPQLSQTIATKVQGLRNILSAINTSQLRVLISFSSIIARIGLPGEAHYGLANEWLTRLTEDFQRGHPSCKCLAVEWSVWSGVGMAQRIGGIDSLARAGITPITPDEGVSILCRLLAQPRPTVAVVVTGRYGEAPTLKIDRPELPLLRFLERPRVYYPGVELIAESDLSSDTDPYLVDHVYQNERLLPAVVGLEAMSQVAMALDGSGLPPVFEDVEFSRPVVVPGGRSITIRVAAYVREPGLIEVVLRSEETAFQADHFRGVCRFTKREGELEGEPLFSRGLRPEATRVDIDPARDLYGSILFHTGRFRLLKGYEMLTATECVAEVGMPSSNPWFGGFLPPALVLGDPSVRDAAIHAVQACIPHATLLPVGIDRLTPSSTIGSANTFVRARERFRDGNLFVYDLDVADEQGRLLERIEGLRLRMVGQTAPISKWPEALLAPYVERLVRETVPGPDVAVAIDRDDGAERRAVSDRLIRRALGEMVTVSRRSDGKPEVEGDKEVSVSHAHGLTLAVAGTGPLGCDIETVVSRTSSVWYDLLGPERFALGEVIAKETGEEWNVSATRVWTAIECMKKAGAMVNAALVLSSSTGDGWVLLSSGPLLIATLATDVRGAEDRLVLSILVKEQKCGHMSTAT